MEPTFTLRDNLTSYSSPSSFYLTQIPVSLQPNLTLCANETFDYDLDLSYTPSAQLYFSDCFQQIISESKETYRVLLTDNPDDRTLWPTVTNISDLFDLNSSLASDHDEFDEQLASDKYNWLFLSLILVVFVGILGNVLVCLAVCLEKRLQNATNFFLLSLAVADLLVSLLVMPIAILEQFYGAWPFGATVCNLWVTCDILFCSSSIWHMVIISVGRYIGIRNPLHARQTPLLVSRRAVLVKIALAWLLSALITSPITILALIDQSNIQPDPSSCLVSNRYFLFLGSFSAFFLPMLVMMTSYVLTVRLLSRKAKFCQSMTVEGHKPDTANSSPNLEASRTLATPKKQPDATCSEAHACARRTISVSSESSSSAYCTSIVIASTANAADTTLEMSSRPRTRRQRNQFLKSSIRNAHAEKKKSLHKERETRYNTQPLMIRTLGSSLQVRTEQKATKVLGLVFFVFVICWSPFFTMNVIMAFVPNLPVPNYLANTFLWLGYLSSTMNPVIYTIFNRNFRRAFRKILLCQSLSASPSALARRPTQREPIIARRKYSSSLKSSHQAHEQELKESSLRVEAEAEDRRLRTASHSASASDLNSRPHHRYPVSLSLSPTATSATGCNNQGTTTSFENTNGQCQRPPAKWSGDRAMPLSWRFSAQDRRFNNSYNCSQL